MGPLLLSTNPLTLQTSVIYFFCSLKHEKEGECGHLPAMGIPTEPKDELSIIYSYSVSFMVSSPTLFFFLLSLSLEEQNLLNTPAEETILVVIILWVTL